VARRRAVATGVGRALRRRPPAATVVPTAAPWRAGSPRAAAQSRSRSCRARSRAAVQRPAVVPSKGPQALRDLVGIGLQAAAIGCLDRGIAPYLALATNNLRRAASSALSAPTAKTSKDKFSCMSPEGHRALKRRLLHPEACGHGAYRSHACVPHDAWILFHAATKLAMNHSVNGCFRRMSLGGW